MAKSLKIIRFCLIVCGLQCFLLFAKPQSVDIPSNDYAQGISFNGWYHSGKKKWQGDYHDQLLFSWYTKRTEATNLADYRKLVNEQRKKGVKFIGYSYSCIKSAPPQYFGTKVRFPEGTIPPERIKYSWILRDAEGQLVTYDEGENKYILDIGKKEVRDGILNRAVSNAIFLDSDVLFLDNWNYMSWAPSGQTREQWAKKNMDLIIKARELTKQNNLKLIVNQASPLKYWHIFAPYLDGISYEMSAHENYLRRKEIYKLELDTYEKMMAMGKSIFLFTFKKPGPNKEWDPDGRKIAATAMLVMQKNQPYWGGIYVCPPIYEAWPVGGWPMWPQQLGEPLEPRKWDGNTVSRKFERGIISVRTGESPKFSIKIEY